MSLKSARSATAGHLPGNAGVEPRERQQASPSTATATASAATLPETSFSSRAPSPAAAKGTGMAGQGRVRQEEIPADLKRILRTSAPRVPEGGVGQVQDDARGRPLAGSPVARGKIRRMGVVWKKGQINTAYRRRFFVLDNGILRYYRDQKAFQGGTKWLGALSCENMQVEEDTGKSKEGRFQFRLTDTQGRVLECACERVAERQAWCGRVLCVMCVCDLVRVRASVCLAGCVRLSASLSVCLARSLALCLSRALSLCFHHLCGAPKFF